MYTHLNVSFKKNKPKWLFQRQYVDQWRFYTELYIIRIPFSSVLRNVIYTLYAQQNYLFRYLFKKKKVILSSQLRTLFASLTEVIERERGPRAAMIFLRKQQVSKFFFRYYNMPFFILFDTITCNMHKITFEF